MYCAAARLASAANWLWVGRLGALTESDHVPTSALVAGWAANVAVAGQLVVPAGTPWQYCTVERLHVSAPPIPAMKSVRYGLSADGSLRQPVPQKSISTAGAVITGPPLECSSVWAPAAPLAALTAALWPCMVCGAVSGSAPTVV